MKTEDAPAAATSDCEAASSSKPMANGEANGDAHENGVEEDAEDVDNEDDDDANSNLQVCWISPPFKKQRL